MKTDEKIKEMILNHLKKHRECSIGEIAAGIGASRPTVSKYLKILEAEGKVMRREKLPYIYYSLAPGSGV